MSASAMAMLVIDARGRIRHCNGGAAELLGRLAREVQGLSLAEVMPEMPLRQETPGYNLAFLILNYGLEAWNAGSVRAADGRQVPVELFLTMMELGRRQWIAINLRQPGAAASSRSDLERLMAHLETSPDAAVITDRAGLIEYVNPTYGALSGYSLAEAVGQSADILKSGLHSSAFYKKMGDALTAGRTYRAVFAHRAKSGRVFYLDETIRPFKDTQGRITHYVMDGQDVSHQILAEGEIQYGAAQTGLNGLVSRLI